MEVPMEPNSDQMDPDDDNSKANLLNPKKIKIDHNYRPESLPKLKIRNVEEELKDVMRVEQSGGRGKAVIQDDSDEVEEGDQKPKLKIKIPEPLPAKIQPLDKVKD